MTETEKKKKKITLNAIGIILLVIIGVAHFYLWQARTTTVAEAAALSGNLTMIHLQIGSLAGSQDDLQAQLDKLQAEMTAAKTGFPNTIDRNEVIDYLLEVAADYKVGILPVVSGGWVEENQGQPYLVLKIKASAQGSLKDVENFMTGVQAGRYPTLVITGCQVTRTDVNAAGFPGDEMLVKVNMEIGIYTVAPPLGEGAL
jgi:hypothetical protein